VLCYAKFTEALELGRFFGPYLVARFGITSTEPSGSVAAVLILSSYRRHLTTSVVPKKNEHIYHEDIHTKTNDVSKIQAFFITFLQNFHSDLWISASVSKS
jgi:hypothetical protein